MIQDNLSLFEKNILDPISELERTQLFKKLIDAFPKKHPLKRYRGDVYFEINNLQKLFSNMKREGWTVDYLLQSIDNYINDLPNRDEYIAKKAVGTFKKGDVRTDKIKVEAVTVGVTTEYYLQWRIANSILPAGVFTSPVGLFAGTSQSNNVETINADCIDSLLTGSSCTPK